MANKYTSDLHLGDSRIIKSIRTEFHSVEEMDAYLINQYNEHVDDNDEIWILGDLFFRAKYDVKLYLEKLKGKKHLIIGNHDKWMKNVKLSDYFETVDNMHVIKDGKKVVTLCHYPMFEWTGSRYAKYSPEGVSFHIHGHLHSDRRSLTYHSIRENLPCALNCSCDVNKYHPVTFEELMDNNDKFYDRVQHY